MNYNPLMTDINYSLSFQLGNILLKQRKRLVLVESCTGGGLSEQVTSVQGSSQWFDRAYVTYSNEAKMELLRIDPGEIEKNGAVSKKIAKLMAKNILEQSYADVSLSITGFAGPGGGTPKKPVGTVWFAIADKEGFCQARQAKFESDRKQIRSSSIQFALSWLIKFLT